jgi:hypothetical protein
MSEVITSLDLNFVNNGGGHTASITTVLNSVSVSGESELGVLNGSLGERYSFSNSDIQDLMKQFVAIEESISEDSNNVETKVTKFQDIVSLKLKSHAVLCRGTSASPYEELEFEGNVYKYSEHPNSPVNSIPEIGIKKYGGCFVMGETYSSKQDEFRLDPYLVTYRDKEIEDNFSYNLEIASQDSNSNNLSDYSLKYGYTTGNVKTALKMIGIDAISMPSAHKLFETSGSLESVVSSIAQSLGYYWTINPFNGKIEFINSMEAMQLFVQDPRNLPQSEKVNIQNSSYSQSKIKKVILNSFIGDFRDEQQDGEDKDRDRETNFYLVAPEKYLSPEFYINLGHLYGLWATENWNNFMFDAFFYYNLFEYIPKGFFDENTYPDLPELIPLDPQSKPFKELIGYDVDLVEQTKQANSPFGDRSDAYYYNLAAFSTTEKEENPSYLAGKTMLKPSSHKIYPAIKAYFDTIGKHLYISRTYPENTAKKMEFGGDDIDVLGPFDKTKKISDVDELDFLKPLLEYFKDDGDLVIEDLFPETDTQTNDTTTVFSVSNDFVFLALKSNENTIIDVTKDENKSLDFSEYLTEKNVDMVFNSPIVDNSFVGYREDTMTTMGKAIERSKALFAEVEGVYDKRIKIPYTKRKRIKTDEEDDDSNEDKQTSSSGEDVSADFERKYYDVLFGACDGDPLKPVTLDVTNGSIAEVKALQVEAAFINTLPRQPMTSASRTYFSLKIPTESEYNITMNSVSIKLNGGNGISTTISESNKDLIPEDDSIVVGQFNKAVNQRSSSNKFSARQKNFFGL